MGRGSAAIVVMALVGQMSGCAACSAPYDDCVPTFVDPGCDDCMIHGRLGSILGPGGHQYWGASRSEYSVDGPELADEESMPYYDRGETDGQQQYELMPPDLGEPEDSEFLPEPNSESPLFDDDAAPMGRRPRSLRMRR